jgi:Toprim domain
LNCFAGCTLEAILASAGLEKKDLFDQPLNGNVHPYFKQKPQPQGREEKKPLTPGQRDYWYKSTKPIPGTLVEKYLRSGRCIDVDFSKLQTLRSFKECPYYESSIVKCRYPAMIAAVCDFDGNIVQLQRTYLSVDGSGKAPEREPKKCCNALMPHFGVLLNAKNSLIRIGEGIETILSIATVLGLDSAQYVAALSNTHLAAWHIPPWAKVLEIYRDDGLPGIRAATELAKRARAAGLQVKIFSPGNFEDERDFNNLLKGGGSDAVRAVIATPIDEAVERESNPQTAPDGDDTIRVGPGTIPCQVEQAEPILTRHAEELRIFQRHGLITRIIKNDKPVIDEYVQRPAGSVQLEPVESIYLRGVLEKLIYFEKLDEFSGEKKRADCPKRLPDTYLARHENYTLPHLTGVIECPIVLRDGSILHKAGYDRRSGLYLFTEEDWPNIGDVTKDDARQALEELIAPFDQFPFVGGGAKSVFITAILTAIQRRRLKSAPMFGFSATIQRTGKSRLAEALGLLALGRIPSVSPIAEDPNEFRKALIAILVESQPITNFDNVETEINSRFLAMVLTQPTYSDRWLGVSKMMTAPTNQMFITTGNNLRFRGDCAVRSLICKLDAKMEHPETRTFKIEDLDGYLLKNRNRLVMAALTILRAYHLAGRPKIDAPAWGGFEQWCDEIRQPLLWLGCADPCSTRKDIEEKDPERESTLNVFEAWFDAVKDQSITAPEIILKANQRDDLKAALLEIAADHRDRTVIDGRRFGKWCHSKLDRIVADFKLTCDSQKTDRRVRWILTRANDKYAMPATDASVEYVNRTAPAANGIELDLSEIELPSRPVVDQSKCPHVNRHPNPAGGYNCNVCNSYFFS